MDDKPEITAWGEPSQDVSKAHSGYKLLAPKPHQRITPDFSLRPSQSPESSGQAEPRRPQTRQEWDAVKDIIRQLYLVENFTLEEVADTMLREYSLAATKRMYKRQFKRWDWKKYNTQSVQESKETGRVIEMSQGQTTCRRPMRNKRNINIESAWAIGKRSSARVPTASVTPPTKLSCANGDEKRTLQLFISLRDLIHRTFRRDNAGWSSGELRFTGLPSTGRLLVSQMDQAIRLFESKHHKQGGMMLREVFRNLEDVMKRDAIEIYQVVLLYIPFYIPGRYEDVTRAWLHYVSQMLSLMKRQDPISQLAQLLYLIHLNDAERLAPALERLFSITADTYTEFRGTKDLSAISATIELLLVNRNSGTLQKSTIIIQELGSLVEEAAAQFGETSETTIGIEACQITAAARLMVAPTDPKIIELCRTHVERAFRGIEDVIDKDALTIFQSLFLEISLRLLETGNILMTQIYTRYLWKMLQAKKREEPITQMAEMLHAISISTPEALLYYLRQMHLILADILTQIRGDIDYNTINARMRTLHLQQNYGCDVSQSYLECLDSFGVLARNSTTKFGGLAFEMSRVEVRRTKANIEMTHAPIALKELSDRSLAELMAGHDHSAFLQTSRSISDLAQYALATFFIHECLIQYGDLDGGSMCLMRIIETLERAQAVSSDSVIKLYLAGQLLRVRLKLSDILTVARKFDEAAAVMEDAHIMRYIGELI
ncbi:hypothetical protein CGLO_07426 [Colletotrichum gloeosporioides Cg-14]|uniref:Clr5 domain-containing protein n=1 Tax=Colletotrichum gloeosporioides (strain Cg-14) TaxID=1237896 RepID=T0LWY2_COLGC|nr:hypothetical protein CGLO_07426 [Colletotrichum gloeosporioides Cg-14]